MSAIDSAIAWICDNSPAPCKPEHILGLRMLLVYTVAALVVAVLLGPKK